MQMILIERCTFYLPTANIIRTKAKVRVSPKGWRTVFGRFAECKFPFARRQKCVSAPKDGARSLEDLPSAKINIILETCKRLTVFYFLYSINKNKKTVSNNS